MTETERSKGPALLPFDQVPMESAYDDVAIAAVYIGHCLTILGPSALPASRPVSDGTALLCLNLMGEFYGLLADSAWDGAAHLDAARRAFRPVHLAAVLSQRDWSDIWAEMTGGCNRLRAIAREAGYVI